MSAMEPYFQALAFLLAAGAMLFAGRSAAKWIDRSTAAAAERHAALRAVARWVPVSERLPRLNKGEMPFIVRALPWSPLWGVYYLTADGPEWQCSVTGFTYPAAEVLFWYDLPQPPEVDSDPARKQEEER